MRVANVFRTDPTNAGDWHCAPFRYFDLGDSFFDVLDTSNKKKTTGAEYPPPPDARGEHVVLGGGGLIAKSFHESMAALAARRSAMLSLVAWGIGESEHVDRRGGLVAPYAGPLPEYMRAFDLIGLRDVGGLHDSRVEWAPCVSCMSPLFDQPRIATREAVIYEHKRIPIPIDGLERMTNDGGDMAPKLDFLASAEIVITNSYHGAYWATLLGRRVIAVPNMSKMYRFRHAPIICAPDAWRRYASLAQSYADALDECRAASRAFYRKVAALHAAIEEKRNR